MLVTDQAYKQTVHHVYQYMQSLTDEGNYKVIFKPVVQRTIAMNSCLHAKCADIANQIVLTDDGYQHADYTYGVVHAKNFTTTDWKHILMAGYSKSELVPGVESGQAVCLYPSTTDLSYSRGMDFIEYINAFGDEMGVIWSEQEEDKRGPKF